MFLIFVSIFLQYVNNIEFFYCSIQFLVLEWFGLGKVVLLKEH